jgi:hypothetical protein
MIRVQFTCRNCGLYRHSVRVRERHTKEHIGGWMFAVAAAIGRTHDTLSPNCKADRMSEVLIPVPDDGSPIGSKDGTLRTGNKPPEQPPPKKTL